MANTTVRPLRMEVRFKNNIILKMMEELGFKSVAELCRKAKIGQDLVNKIIRMNETPLRKDGTWRAGVAELADALGCLPEEMFSEEQLEIKLAKSRAFAEITFGEVRELLALNDAEYSSPEKALELSELAQRIEEALVTLEPREAEILRLLYGIGEEGDSTHEEVALQLDVASEEIRLIEHKALRKLRHPARSEHIRAFAGFEWR